MTHRQELSPKQSRAAAVLAAGERPAAAALAAGVDVRTVERWRRLPQFEAVVRSTVSDAFADAVAVLADGAHDAASYLADVAAGRAPAVGGRVNAARLVLTLGPAMRDAVELENRLQAVEAVIGGQDA